jgi:hypothetical protein
MGPPERPATLRRPFLPTKGMSCDGASDVTCRAITEVKVF